MLSWPWCFSVSGSLIPSFNPHPLSFIYIFPPFKIHQPVFFCQHCQCCICGKYLLKPGSPLLLLGPAFITVVPVSRGLYVTTTYQSICLCYFQILAASTVLFINLTALHVISLILNIEYNAQVYAFPLQNASHIFDLRLQN